MTQNERAQFALAHGKRTTDRLVPELLETIVTLLEGKSVGNGFIKRLGDVRERDGEWSVLFDVKNPDETFDHIEFKITKTGWGRAL